MNQKIIIVAVTATVIIGLTFGTNSDNKSASKNKQAIHTHGLKDFQKTAEKSVQKATKAMDKK